VTRLSVGLNLLWLVPGEVGGSEQSTMATVGGLLAREDLDLRLFVLPDLPRAHPEVVGAARLEVAPTDGRSRARRILTESTWLRSRTRGLDLVHHAGGTVPLRRGAPAVLTLHDLQPLEATATHGPLKRAYLRRAVPAALRAARRVAVASEFVRGGVLDRFGLDPSQVVVIPHAAPVRPPATDPAVLRDRYRLAGPVVLYPAITYPHKDHRTLLLAFAATAADHPDAVLVLPGGEGAAEGAVQQLVADRPDLRDRVRRIGRVPEADLAGLLDLADVVAVPSRYEGFGLPALEAMAAGVAVVAASGTSLPEVVGEAGFLVAPGDVDAWAAALHRLLGDPAERERLAAAGRARASRYSVAANAAAFHALYEAALGA
jgi:alpha-1,3-rhamnosyl/mannosyltransferase